MEITNWVFGGGLIGLVGLVLANNRQMDKKIEDNNIEMNKKIQRAYERLDGTKGYQDNTFTRKDICEVLHKRISDDLSEIKSDVKLLIKNSYQYQGISGIQGPKGEKGDKGDRS